MEYNEYLSQHLAQARSQEWAKTYRLDPWPLSIECVIYDSHHVRKLPNLGLA